MTLEEQLEKAAKDVMNLKTSPGNDRLLSWYALDKPLDARGTARECG